MSFIDAGFTQAEKALEWANKWHQTVVLWTIVGGTFAIVLGVLANLVGFPGSTSSLPRSHCSPGYSS
jgi:hypothetical protein